MENIMNLWKLVCGFIFAIFYLPAALAASGAPVGKWVTIDDKTGEKRAIVTISESGGTLSAVIDKVFPQPGDTGICEKCPGGFKGKKIVGLRFMWGLKNEGDNEWSGGSILDPKSGKVYRAKITAQGNKLLVRGYLGISLLGRTQVWHRE
jgi:uncharacterized protein (DUF2147 family)